MDEWSSRLQLAPRYRFKSEKAYKTYKRHELEKWKRNHGTPEQQAEAKLKRANKRKRNKVNRAAREAEQRNNIEEPERHAAGTSSREAAAILAYPGQQDGGLKKAAAAPERALERGQAPKRDDSLDAMGRELGMKQMELQMHGIERVVNSHPPFERRQAFTLNQAAVGYNHPFIGQPNFRAPVQVSRSLEAFDRHQYSSNPAPSIPQQPPVWINHGASISAVSYHHEYISQQKIQDPARVSTNHAAVDRACHSSNPATFMVQQPRVWVNHGPSGSCQKQGSKRDDSLDDMRREMEKKQMEVKMQQLETMRLQEEMKTVSIRKDLENTKRALPEDAAMNMKPPSQPKEPSMPTSSAPLKGPFSYEPIHVSTTKASFQQNYHGTFARFEGQYGNKKHAPALERLHKNASNKLANPDEEESYIITTATENCSCSMEPSVGRGCKDDSGQFDDRFDDADDGQFDDANDHQFDAPKFGDANKPSSASKIDIEIATGSKDAANRSKISTNAGAPTEEEARGLANNSLADATQHQLSNDAVDNVADPSLNSQTSNAADKDPSREIQEDPSKLTHNTRDTEQEHEPKKNPGGSGQEKEENPKIVDSSGNITSSATDDGAALKVLQPSCEIASIAEQNLLQMVDPRISEVLEQKKNRFKFSMVVIKDKGGTKQQQEEFEEQLRKSFQIQGKETKELKDLFRQDTTIRYRLVLRDVKLCTETTHDEFVAGAVVSQGEASELVNYYLDYIFVNEKYRRNRMGSFLLDTIEKDLCSHVDILKLQMVQNDQGSLKFYGKAGYLPCTGNMIGCSHEQCQLFESESLVRVKGLTDKGKAFIDKARKEDATFARTATPQAHDDTIEALTKYYERRFSRCKRDFEVFERAYRSNDPSCEKYLEKLGHSLGCAKEEPPKKKARTAREVIRSPASHKKKPATTQVDAGKCPSKLRREIAKKKTLPEVEKQSPDHKFSEVTTTRKQKQTDTAAVVTTNAAAYAVTNNEEAESSTRVGSGITTRRRTREREAALVPSALPERPKVLCLGVSYASMHSQLDEYGEDHEAYLEGRDHLVVEDIIAAVLDGYLTEMDGRDLARVIATEALFGADIYTVSQENAAKYDKNRHLYANFNCPRMLRYLHNAFAVDEDGRKRPDQDSCNIKAARKKEIKEKFKIRFRQIILDYYWIPPGWDRTHWQRKLFEEILPSFVQKMLMDMRDVDMNTGTFDLSCGIFLPFCLHSFRQIITALPTLSEYFGIYFLRKKDLFECSLWAGTQTIDADKMQHILGKQHDQENIYCTFDYKAVKGCGQMSDEATKEQMIEIIRQLEDFHDIRMIKLAPLPQHHPDPDMKLPREVGGLQELVEPELVKNGMRNLPPIKKQR